MAPRQRSAITTFAFAAAVTLLALVFHAGLSANPGSRVLTVLALVEHGSLVADDWRDLTIDRAHVGHHFYSDKAPLSSFAVVPFFAVWRAIAHHPLGAADIDVAVTLGDIVVAAIPFAGFVVLLWRRAARETNGRDAVWIALLAAFGTSAFPYAGMYYGHVLAGALFVLAWHFATRDLEPRPLACGVLAGLAVLTEYPMLLPAVVLGGYVALRQGVKGAARYVAGGAPSAIVACACNAAITGDPFEPAYRHPSPQFFAPWGRAFALDAQAAHAARMLLTSEFRGLLVYAPALILLLPLVLVRTGSEGKRAFLIALGVIQFGFVASFFRWDGGWAIGPRHLIPLIMLVLYEGVGAIARTPRLQAPFVGLAAIGVALNLLATATNPFVEGFDHPFRDLYWPAFARGEITPDNLFAAAGLHAGQASLAGWVALFLATGFVFARLSSRPTA